MRKLPVLKERITKTTILMSVLSGVVSLYGLTACSSGGSTSGGGGQSDSSADSSNARDLFYHNLSSSSGASAASTSHSDSSANASGSGSASGSGGSSAGGSGSGKMAAAFCWEIRSTDMGPMSILCHTFPKAGFKQGDGLRFHFRPSQPCYAYIVMWKGSSGKETVPLYPADGNTEEKLEAGKEYAVPEQGMLEFDNKPGEEDMGFILSPTPLGNKKARELATTPTMINPNTLSAGQKTESGPLSLFSASDQKVPVSDYKTTDRGDADRDPFAYVDNAKDPGKPIIVGIPFPHT